MYNQQRQNEIWGASEKHRNVQDSNYKCKKFLIYRSFLMLVLVTHSLRVLTLFVKTSNRPPSPLANCWFHTCAVVDLGGTSSMHPPTSQNFLDFMQFFGKFDKIACWHPLEVGAPSYRESWICPCCGLCVCVCSGRSKGGLRDMPPGVKILLISCKIVCWRPLGVGSPGSATGVCVYVCVCVTFAIHMTRFSLL